MPKMITKDGWLTAFAMACGHVEQSLTPWAMDDHRIVLLREGGIYHLRDNHGSWKGYHNIKAARKAYIARLRQNGLKRGGISRTY